MKNIARRLGLALGVVLLVVAAARFEQRRSGTGGFEPVAVSGSYNEMGYLQNMLTPRDSAEPWYWLGAGAFLIVVCLPLRVGGEPRREVC